jgi:AcrR family transcriptional regulator
MKSVSTRETAARDDGTSARESVPTRERILIAAAELFRRQGYAATGLKQIVAEADAPFGSIYHHFPGGKEQLCEEVIQAGGTFFLILVGTVYQAEPDAISGLRAVFDAAAETLEATDYADACPIATIALEVASTNECLRQASADAFQAWLDALTQRLQADGCPPTQAPLLATATIAALEGAFVLARTQRSTVPMHAAKAMVEQSVTHALRRA